MWNRKVFIRIIELLLCVACVVALRVTDDESRRVFHYLRNRSREWSLLNNVTWGAIGAALATATCGGYVIVTAGLLVAAATGELRGRKTELFFLGLGVILFGIVGALSLASIESVPEDLIDNAAVLGALCLFTALVFIADLLMSPPRKESKQEGTQIFLDKDAAKRHITTTVKSEKESKSPKISGTGKTPAEEKPERDVGGTVNDGFEKSDDRRRGDMEPAEQSMKDVVEAERNRTLHHAERDLREYTDNFENGRALRESARFRREAEALQRRSSPGRGSFEDSKMVYRPQDVYQRPIDEIDTPRFPTFDDRPETAFAKIVNPGVKIMKVERDVEEALDNYRYSDSSQYDNVPTRMRGNAVGILKKGRDVSFNVPPPPKNGRASSKDEIEMLEEAFGVLRTTGTQTGAARTPSSPTDPGYVKHTASNWPQDRRTQTPGGSPDHTKNL